MENDRATIQRMNSRSQGVERPNSLERIAQGRRPRESRLAPWRVGPDAPSPAASRRVRPDRAALIVGLGRQTGSLGHPPARQPARGRSLATLGELLRIGEHRFHLILAEHLPEGRHWLLSFGQELQELRIALARRGGEVRDLHLQLLRHLSVSLSIGAVTGRAPLGKDLLAEFAIPRGGCRSHGEADHQNRSQRTQTHDNPPLSQPRDFTWQAVPDPVWAPNPSDSPAGSL